MKGQYFSFDALIGAIIFLTIIVVAVGMFLSSSFTQKLQEEELRLYALKVGNMLLSPYSYASLKNSGPVDAALFNTVGSRVNALSPYKVAMSLYSYGGCTFTYPVYGKGRSATVYRITTLDVQCGQLEVKNAPALLVITVYG